MGSLMSLHLVHFTNKNRDLYLIGFDEDFYYEINILLNYIYFYNIVNRKFTNSLYRVYMGEYHFKCKSIKKLQLFIDMILIIRILILSLI
jgi:hypothetical protein